MCASTNNRGSRRPRRRRGYTLIELIVAMSTGAVVMAGLSSTLYIAAKSVTPDATASAESSRTSLILEQLTSDLRLALTFTERTNNAVTFTVPDRTGDGVADTIRYSWSGTAGASLLYQFNGGTVLTLVTNVRQFKFTPLTRTIAAASAGVPQTVTYQPPHSETAVSSTSATSIGIATPAGLMPGNLLIAAVAVRGSVAASLAAPAGWTAVAAPAADATGPITLGVWYKIATVAETPTFTWTGGAEAYGWIMRFSGAESTSPITSAVTAGSSATTSPPCPAVTTTVANSMVVRIGAFNEATITVDQASAVSTHTTITLDRSAADTASAVGGAAYKSQAAVGTTGTATFGLTTPNKRYVTMTLAIKPEDGL